MSKQDATFKVVKIYGEGQHIWTTKVVGRTALINFMRKMADVMEDDRGNVSQVTWIRSGRYEADIRHKEEINKKAFQEVEEHDYNDEPKESEREEKQEEEEDKVEVDKQTVEELKDVLGNMGLEIDISPKEDTEKEEEEYNDCEEEDDEDDSLVLPRGD